MSWIAVGANSLWAVDSRDAVGKKPDWDSMTELLDLSANQSDVAQSFVSEEETPNQRRRRLGQPIEATFPAEEYGETLETPNQRRNRIASVRADL